MDDARFESIVVKQTKQSKLEEARQRANGKISKYLIQPAEFRIRSYYLHEFI